MLQQNRKCEMCEQGRRESSKLFYKRRIHIHKMEAETYFLKKIEKQEGGKKESSKIVAAVREAKARRR